MNIVEIYPMFKSISLSSLKDVHVVENLIKKIGLHDDPRISDHYGDNERNYLVNNGSLQQPRQLAEALAFLSNQEIKSYLEIGTFNGITTVIISSYLRCFEKDFEAVTVDIGKEIDRSALNIFASQGLVIKQVKGTSDILKGTKSDLCFIDGDHNYEWVKKDFENVGKYARICMFHDIIDEWVADVTDGGSIKFWRELQKKYPKKSFHQFTYHPENKNYFGIGVMK